MNKRSLYRLLIFSSLAVLTVVGCKLTEEDLTRDMRFYFSGSPLDSPVALQFINANTTVLALPENIELILAGKDKEKIYTIVGEKGIDLKGNIATVSLRPEDVPTRERPITFTVIAKAAGYLDAIATVTIVDKKRFEMLPIRMIQKANPPKGVSIVERNFTAEVGGTAQNLNFETPLSIGKQEVTKIDIPQGTKFYDNKGAQLTGTAQLTLAHFDTRTQGSVAAFPGGLNPTYVLDSTNAQLRPGNFISAGFIAMDIEIGGKEVKTLSQPMRVAAQVRNQLNPQTNQPFAAGDKIGIWSLDEQNGVWKQETEGTAELVNGKLEIAYPQQHLSWWNLDWFFQNQCQFWGWYAFNPANTDPWGAPFAPSPTQGGVINIQSNINAFSCPNGNRLFYAELYDPYNEFGFIHSYYEPFVNGSRFQVVNYIGGIPAYPLRLRIYDGSWSDKGNTIFESQNLLLCDPQNVNMTLPVIQNVEVGIKFTGVCSGTPPLGISPSAAFYYRPQGSFFWDYLAYMYKGEGCSGQFVKGRNYDMKVVFSSFNKEIPNVKIPQADSIMVVGTDTLRMRYETSTRLMIEMFNVRLSDELCQKFK